MKKTVKFLKYFMLLIIILAAFGFTYLMTAYPKVSPPPELKVEATPENIERGRYLANHVMLCMDCHAERDFSLYSGPPKPGTEGAGGDRFDHTMQFPGVFYSRNITPAGVGNWTDGELFRLITTGVTKDGKPMFPVMPYQSYGKLDPEDIKAVIAYLRTLQPIENELPESKADFPVNLVLRTIPTEATMAQMPDKQDLAAYGKYITTAAACAECHTDVDDKGNFIGEPLAGGRAFPFPDGTILRTANLTPDNTTGLGAWTEEQFVQRFKMNLDSSLLSRPLNPGEFQTIMPWIMYAGMDTTDLRAIYAYLRTLPAVSKEVVKVTPPASPK